MALRRTVDCSLNSQALLNPVPVRKWAILNQSELSEAKLMEFGAEMVTMAGKSGIVRRVWAVALGGKLLEISWTNAHFV